MFSTFLHGHCGTPRLVRTARHRDTLRSRLNPVPRMQRISRCLAIWLLAHAACNILGADGRDVERPIAVSIGSDGMSYYRRSAAIVDSILAGDLAAAEAGTIGLEELRRPQPLFFADVHNTIGVAFGESGHFEAGIAHVAKALGGGGSDLPPRLVAEARAYLAYFHAAALRFSEADRLIALLEDKPPWLHAKLATTFASQGNYVCAVANAEKALQAARAGGTVASRWTKSRATEPVDRDVVLADWSMRLDALKRKAANAEPADGAVAVSCVGT